MLCLFVHYPPLDKLANPGKSFQLRPGRRVDFILRQPVPLDAHIAGPPRQRPQVPDPIRDRGAGRQEPRSLQVQLRTAGARQLCRELCALPRRPADLGFALSHGRCRRRCRLGCWSCSVRPRLCCSRSAWAHDGLWYLSAERPRPQVHVGLDRCANGPRIPRISVNQPKPYWQQPDRLCTL